MEDEIIGKFEADGEIIPYKKLFDENYEIASDRKRIFIYDEEKAKFFLILNPAQRRFIKTFANDDTAYEVAKVLKIVTEKLKESGFEGIFEKLVLRNY